VVQEEELQRAGQGLSCPSRVLVILSQIEPVPLLPITYMMELNPATNGSGRASWPCLCPASALPLPCLCPASALPLPCFCPASALPLPCLCPASALPLQLCKHTCAYACAQVSVNLSKP
jgi:hypothetical protein